VLHMYDTSRVFTIKGPFTYRRPSSNQRQCQPLKKVSEVNGLSVIY